MACELLKLVPPTLQLHLYDKNCYILDLQFNSSPHPVKVLFFILGLSWLLTIIV